MSWTLNLNIKIMASNEYTSGEGASANLFNQSLYEADYGKSSQEMSTTEKKELANDPTINLPEFMELAKNSPEKKAFIDFLEKTDGTFVQNEESKGGSGRIYDDVLVFFKGNPKAIKNVFGECQGGEVPA